MWLQLNCDKEFKKYNKNKILYQTVYKFGNQFCYGYKNKIVMKNCSFKDQTQVNLFFW